MASQSDSILDTGLQTGRRSSARLRLSLPAIFISTKGSHTCIITNLSRTGVLIAISSPLALGTDGFLRCGPLDEFVTVTRSDKGLNAVEFESPIETNLILQVRELQDGFAAFERQELIATARRWTIGEA